MINKKRDHRPSGLELIPCRASSYLNHRGCIAGSDNNGDWPKSRTEQGVNVNQQAGRICLRASLNPPGCDPKLTFRAGARRHLIRLDPVTTIGFRSV